LKKETMIHIELINVTIRKVKLDDLETMTNYRLDYLTELQGEKDEVYKKKLKEDLLIFFKMTMEKGSFFALMAEQEGEVLAFGGMVIKQIPGDFNQSSYLEGDILNMYTIPTARRKGISSLILERLLKEAREIGISKVALHTSKDGELLYRKFGFKDPVYPYLELPLEMGT
jgi:GNAT superfamily N-acetyltransferase